ncbi:MAG: polysaccharide biosynthesis/export family protein [Clostridia bacterium]|nr:polysaccharide biosynthesis/export family protein [Deltaproteobacteria bacterium]
MRPFMTLALVTIAACGAASRGVTTSVKAGGSAPTVTGTAVLGVGDVFDVRVFGEDDMSGTYRISPDGTIDFPLIGKVAADGETAGSLSGILATSLAKYLKSPSVSVFVKEYNSKKVFVLGQVKAPGTFPYEQHMNIVQAVTMAGGFDKLADQNATSVTRVVDGREQRMKVAVTDIGEGRAPNFELRPGDIVFVPETLF